MRLKIYTRGLSAKEIQAAIDSYKRNKQYEDIPFTELVSELREKILKLFELDKDFAAMALECIKSHYPELLRNT